MARKLQRGGTLMDFQTTLGLGMLTLFAGAIAIAGTRPENRVSYAIHIVIVNGLAYLVVNLK
jgi:hypothetical protein